MNWKSLFDEDRLDRGFKYYLENRVYDVILTGDLGRYGKDILKDFMQVEYNIELKNYDDSACMIYDLERKNCSNENHRNRKSPCGHRPLFPGVHRKRIPLYLRSGGSGSRNRCCRRHRN